MSALATLFDRLWEDRCDAHRWTPPWESWFTSDPTGVVVDGGATLGRRTAARTDVDEGHKKVEAARDAMDEKIAQKRKFGEVSVGTEALAEPVQLLREMKKAGWDEAGASLFRSPIVVMEMIKTGKRQDLYQFWNEMERVALMCGECIMPDGKKSVAVKRAELEMICHTCSLIKFVTQTVWMALSGEK